MSLKSFLQTTGLVEAEEGAHHDDAASSSTIPPLPANIPPAQPASLNTAAPYVPPSFSTTPGAPIVGMTPDDEKARDSIAKSIFAGGSYFTTFRDMRSKLGMGTPVQQVVDITSTANSGFTVAHALTDITRHLSAIDGKRQAFDQEISNAHAAQVDVPQKQIAALTEANAKAAAEINERTAQIGQLQTAAQTAEQTLSNAVAHFKLVEDQLRAPLLEAQTLLTPLNTAN